MTATEDDFSQKIANFTRCNVIDLDKYFYKANIQYKIYNYAIFVVFFLILHKKIS